MDIPDEAGRRYPESVNGHPVLYRSKRSAFIEGAEWARKQTLEEAADAIAKLMGDPNIYTNPAITGVIAATAAVRALDEES